MNNLGKPGSIPSSWRWARLDEISDVTMGTSPPGSSYNTDGFGIPLVNGPVDFGSGPLDRTVCKQYTTDPRKKCKAGDLLLCVRGSTTGRTNIAGFEAAIGRGVASIHSHLNPAYLNYYIVAQRDSIYSLGTGSTFPNVTSARLFEFPVPVAPLNEQLRIAAKIEELFTDLDSSVAALERAKANVERYRAAVLKAAVEGRITEVWRKSHPHAEPASDLLKRILDERRRNWEVNKLAEYEAKSRKPPKNWMDKYKEPAAPVTGDLSLLPDNWCWASIEQLGHVQLGRQRSPKNRSKEFPTKYIRAANITEDGLDLTDIFEMEFTPLELERYQLMKGDVVLAEASGSSDQVGKPAMWNDELPVCCFQNTVIRVRPKDVRSDYLLAIFKHCYFNKVFARIAGGVSINHLTAAKFSKIPIPFAPESEQAELANEIERQLSLLKKTEGLIDKTLKRTADVRRNILLRAFEGKIVPQDPRDEPAETLLEKLKSNLKEAPKQLSKSRSKGHPTMANLRRPLLDVLREHPDGLSPENLFHESGWTLDHIEQFYRELREISKNIEEIRPDGESTLQWPLDAQITLKLRSA